MPNEIVRLQVLLDTPQGIEERLAALDAIIEKLKSNSTVKLNVDAKGLDVLGNSAKKYLDTINAQMSATPLQRQIEALTGVSRQYKSAAESAKVFLEIEKKVGTATGGTFSNLTQLSSAGFQSYLSSVEGLEAASVKAAGSIRAAGSDFQRFTVTAQASGKDVQTFTYAVDMSTGAVYKLDRGLVTASSGLAQTGEQAKLASNSLGNMLAQFLQFQLAYRVISTVISSLKEALAELKRVDTELVNIQKVTKATSGEMDVLSKKAFEVGSNLGVAASDYLASVTKWARAGYGSLADELGELSVRTQKVGDVQEETANQFLLSVDAAYKYRGNIAELTKVLDGANEISNNYSTSVEKLAGGMGLVSSLEAQAGMKVEETMAAIGTITAVTQESGSSAARALRALILNIQGSTEIEIDEGSGERWSEDEIQRTAAALGVHPGKLIGLTDYGNNTWGPEGLPSGELDDIQKRTLAISENQKALNRLKARTAKKEHVIGKLELLNDDELDTIVQVIDAIVGNPRLSIYPSSQPYFQQSQTGAAIEAHSPQSDESDTTK